MSKYYTRVNVKLTTINIQEGDNANEIRLMTKMLIERVLLDSINNNKKLKILFKESKPKINVYIEKINKNKKEKVKKRILPKNILSERIVNIK